MVAVGLALSGKAFAADDVTEAKATLAVFLKTDPDMARVLNSAAGYVVFPSVGKAAVGVGGAHGNGILFEHGTATHRVSMTQVTVGLALGGQSFAEVIFFETPQTLIDFRKGNFAMSANVSAVALTAGASKAAKYTNGVMVFTATKSGLMFEASVGGQKFTLKPLH